MKKLDVESIQRRWLVESVESDMGLWWLASDLREALGEDASEEQVRIATIEAVRPLRIAVSFTRTAPDSMTALSLAGLADGKRVKVIVQAVDRYRRTVG